MIRRRLGVGYRFRRPIRTRPPGLRPGPRSPRFRSGGTPIGPFLRKKKKSIRRPAQPSVREGPSRSCATESAAEPLSGCRRATWCAEPAGRRHRRYPPADGAAIRPVAAAIPAVNYPALVRPAPFGWQDSDPLCADGLGRWLSDRTTAESCTFGGLREGRRGDGGPEPSDGKRRGPRGRQAAAEGDEKGGGGAGGRSRSTPPVRPGPA